MLMVDIRLIAATNHDLRLLIKERKFREDLYHRINGVNIRVPPLRERRTDIPMLADHFLKISCMDKNQPIKTLTGEAAHVLSSHYWPGNVRELKHTMEKAAILIDQNEITVDDIMVHINEPTPWTDPEKDPDKIEEAKDNFEREHILSVLNNTNWKINEAAKVLCIDRSTLFRKMKKLRIQR